MSNAAHALPARLRAAASAIANARAGRRGVPAIANVLDLLPGNLFEEVVEDARAVLADLDALPPEPRKAGPLNAVDASVLRMEVGAEIIAIIASERDGRVRAVIGAAGHDTAVLDHDEASPVWAAVADVLSRLPDDPPSTDPEPRP